MTNLLAVNMPVGRLYDPLLELTERVQRVLGKNKKTLWADDRGSLFLDDTALLHPGPPGAIVGTYDIGTPIMAITDDLRLALRERARRWILDWNDLPVRARRQEPQTILHPKRRRKPRMAAIESGQMCDIA